MKNLLLFMVMFVAVVAPVHAISEDGNSFLSFFFGVADTATCFEIGVDGSGGEWCTANEKLAEEYAALRASMDGGVSRFIESTGNVQKELLYDIVDDNWVDEIMEEYSFDDSEGSELLRLAVAVRVYTNDIMYTPAPREAGYSVYYYNDFDTARILEEKVGYCRQKTVLLLSIYRALGIPARYVVLPYMPGELHAEPQIWNGEEWITVGESWRDTPVLRVNSWV